VGKIITSLARPWQRQGKRDAAAIRSPRSTPGFTEAKGLLEDVA
jgi:hypothetical protein